MDNELFNSLNAKITTTNKQVQKQLNIIKQYAGNDTEQIQSLYKELELYRRMQKEIQNLKKGSIALVNQITTISKIRIYDPKKIMIFSVE